MSRKVKKLLFLAVFAIIIIGTIISIALIKKYKPSEQVMDINDYYQVGEKEALIIFQDGIYEKRAIYEDGSVYLDYETIIGLINKRFYWDNNENLLIYTTPKELIKTSIGSKEYTINKNSDSFSYPITKTKDGMLYVAVSFVNQFSDMEYQFYESPNRILFKDWESIYTSVKVTN